jgi:uncharacterized OB-fold protein
MTVAALVAAIFLYQFIGLMGAAVLVALTIAGMVGYRFYRSRRPARRAGVRCLTCGETLASTARECKYCGSARWTVD